MIIVQNIIVQNKTIMNLKGLSSALTAKCVWDHNERHSKNQHLGLF